MATFQTCRSRHYHDGIVWRPVVKFSGDYLLMRGDSSRFFARLPELSSLHKHSDQRANCGPIGSGFCTAFVLQQKTTSTTSLEQDFLVAIVRLRAHVVNFDQSSSPSRYIVKTANQPASLRMVP